MAVVSATEFKAKCLEYLDRVGGPGLESLSITKHGKVVAQLIPPPARADMVDALLARMEGTVIIPEGFDVTAPALDEPFLADTGKLHW